MAGGNFNLLSGKTRPGSYINFESNKKSTVGISERGIVMLPLFKAQWGPDETFVTVLNSAPDGQMYKFGKSVYDLDPNMLLIRESLKSAYKVLVYVFNKGTKATATVDVLTIKALYGGSIGNSLRAVVETDPLGGFIVSVYLGSRLTSQYANVQSIEALIEAAKADKYVVFSGTGSLTVNAGVQLAGGTDGQVTNADVTKFLDAAEAQKWNTMAFPIDDAVEQSNVMALKTALKTKITYLRNNMGKYVKAAVADFDADFEGIINVTNAIELDTGEVLSHAQATAWVAGVDAAAPNTVSNTYTAYPGAVAIVDPKTNEQAIEAINKGEFFFSIYENNSGTQVIGVEYDINSLVSFTQKKTKDYRKNRVMRVYDTFAEALQVNFPPNKYDNDEIGWGLMEGIGADLLRQFEQAGAIKNVNLDQDFKVDRTMSQGDETYFIVGIEAKDSAEKLYFTINTK